MTITNTNEVVNLTIQTLDFNILFTHMYESVPPYIPNVGETIDLSNPIQPVETPQSAVSTYRVIKRDFGYTKTKSKFPQSGFVYCGIRIIVELVHNQPTPTQSNTPMQSNSNFHNNTDSLMLQETAFNHWFERNGYLPHLIHVARNAWDGCVQWAQHGGDPAEFCLKRPLFQKSGCLLYKGHDNGIHD